MIKAPFTPEQCEQLNRWQQSGVVHPFTCGSSHCHSDLIAAPDGWHCPNCDYTQDWAHDFMMEGAMAEWAQQWSDRLEKARIAHEEAKKPEIPPG